jgi:IS5 family transposase
MRRFAGIELGDDRIPDGPKGPWPRWGRVSPKDTILNFRHLLERHGLTEAIFADVNAHLADKGITLRSGTLVDVSGRTPLGRVSPRKIIDAPSSTRNKAKARDPEMSSTKKGNDWYFGSEEDQQTVRGTVCPTNAHIGVDADSGVTHSLETSTAKLHDSQVGDELLHGEETSVWAELPLARHWSERQWRRLCQR